MSIKSSGGIPRVTSARLDKVRPNVVFFSRHAGTIGRGAANFQARRLNGLNFLNGWNDWNRSRSFERERLEPI